MHYYIEVNATIVVDATDDVEAADMVGEIMKDIAISHDIVAGLNV